MHARRKTVCIFFGLLAFLRPSIQEESTSTEKSAVAVSPMAERTDIRSGGYEEEANILRGPDSSIFVMAALESMTADSYIIAAATRRTNPVFMVDAVTDAQLTTVELLKSSFALAAELQKLGCKKGTIVGIMADNRLECSIIILAVWLTGATYAGFDLTSPLYDLRHQNHLVEPSIYFCAEEEHCKRIERVAAPSAPIIIIDSKPPGADTSYIQYSQLVQSKTKYREVRNSPDDVASLLHSSGTTGQRKRLMTTHRNIVFVLQLLEAGLYENNGPMITSVTSICSSASGLITAWSALVRNETFVVMKNYEERLLLSTIQKYRIRRLALVGSMVRFFVKRPIVDEYDLSSVEYIVCGGESIQCETELSLWKKLPNLRCVQQAYAMTETTFVVALKNPGNPKAGTCGAPVTGVEMKVVDAETGIALGRNEVGIICIKGPLITKGYYKNEKATAAVLDEYGWLRSGDLGYFDEDNDLFVVDRADVLIKSGTVRVAPAELEAALLEHPDVLDAGVIGISHETETELPRAYVVKQEGSQITEDDLIQYMKERMVPEKTLRGGVEFIAALPKTSGGKIARRALKEWWTEGVSTDQSSRSNVTPTTM